MTMSVNIERTFAIVYPLRAATWKKYLMPASVIIAVAYNLPKFFELEVKEDFAGNK
jgi:hypothetical protein